MDQEPRVELLVWLSRIVSPHPSELGTLFHGTELREKGSGQGIFPSGAMARHKAMEGVLVVQDVSL